MGLLPFGRQGGQATRTFRGQDAPAIGDAKPSSVGRKLHAAKYPAPCRVVVAGGLVDCDRLET